MRNKFMARIYDSLEDKAKARKKNWRIFWFLIGLAVIGGIVWLILLSIKSAPNNSAQNAANSATPKSKENNKLTANIENLNKQILLLEKMEKLSAVSCNKAQLPETVKACEDLNIYNIGWLAKKACVENPDETTKNLCKEIEDSKDVAKNLKNSKTEILNLAYIDDDKIPDSNILVENPLDTRWKTAIVCFIIGILIIIAIGIFSILSSVSGKMKTLQESFDKDITRLKDPIVKEAETYNGLPEKPPNSDETPNVPNQEPTGGIVIEATQFSKIEDIIRSLKESGSLSNKTIDEELKNINNNLQSLLQRVPWKTAQVDPLQNQTHQLIDKPLPKEPIPLKELMGKQDDSWIKVKQGKFLIDPLIENPDNPNMYLIPYGNNGFLVPILEERHIEGAEFDDFFRYYYEKRNSASVERKIIKFARVTKGNNGWTFDNNKGIFEFQYE